MEPEIEIEAEIEPEQEIEPTVLEALAAYRLATHPPPERIALDAAALEALRRRLARAADAFAAAGTEPVLVETMRSNAATLEAWW